TGACSRSSTAPVRRRSGSSSRCRIWSPRFLLRLPQTRGRCRALPTSALAGQPLVDASVRERVRLDVAFATDVLELHLVEPLDQRAGLVVEPLERRVLHLPPAGELFDQQAAVRTQEQMGRAELPGAFETADRGRVLGDVVGRDAEPLGDLRDDRTVLVRDLDTDPGGPRVTAGRAVAVQ